MDHWTCIVNPCAGSGRGARHWEKISQLLRREGIPYEVLQTQHSGHAEALASQAIHRGDRKIVAVGGDGTSSEVANGILRQEAVNPLEVKMAVIPVGTGNDWGRTIGIPSHYIAAMRLLKKEKTIVTDVGTVRWKVDGKPRMRYFVNIAGMGFEAYAGVRINEKKNKGNAGKIAYLSGLVSALGSYHALPVKVVMEGISLKRDIFTMAIGICQYNGGGMRQCPQAIYNDGLLDVTIIDRVSKFKVVANLPRIFTGSFVRLNEVNQFRTQSVSVICKENFLLEIDGENIGHGPAEFGILPQALRVVVK
ncbi:MAG: diacylglycerol kinase family lipid kinase [Bacteroidia bacterium]|nr:diacylglycerol kinase family lipid kinase [Bacteroidia bacterium]